MLEKVLAYVRAQALLKPGDRVGVAVSGGADSVALLRALLELRGELGVVLSVVHFNHKIRGAEADAEEAFVAALAEAHDLERHFSSGDVPAHAEKHRLSVEAAARELRYRFFNSLLEQRLVTRIATGHTQDDQAETVLLRVLRGAGTRGLAGIYPRQQGPAETAVVRPLLRVRRPKVEEYLRALGQEWRDDPSNRDPRFARNRVRRELLPLLERDFNPAITQVLADSAEIARAEEEHWAGEIARRLEPAFTLAPGKRQGRNGLPEAENGPAGGALKLSALSDEPLAVQRRLLRAAAATLGLRLDFHQVQELLELCFERKPGGRQVGRTHDLPGGWRARRGVRELRFERVEREPGTLVEPFPSYEYRLSVPGEVRVPEIGSLIRAALVSLPAGGVSRSQLLDPRSVGQELVVRNWRPGDRFWPAYTRSPKKLKDLLQEKHVLRPERPLWPVAARDDKIVWVRGFQPPAQFLAGLTSAQAVIIEEIALAG